MICRDAQRVRPHMRHHFASSRVLMADKSLFLSHPLSLSSALEFYAALRHASRVNAVMRPSLILHSGGRLRMFVTGAAPAAWRAPLPTGSAHSTIMASPASPD
jgi:hypothetical protein